MQNINVDTPDRSPRVFQRIVNMRQAAKNYQPVNEYGENNSKTMTKIK